MTPHHRARWKAATASAIHDSGGVVAAAAILGVSPAQTSRYQIGHAPDILTLSGALKLADASGTRAFAEIFADLAGCRLTAQRDAETPAPAERRALTATMSEAAELVHQIAEALADGTVTGNERALIRRSIGDMRDALADLDRSMMEPAP